MKCETDRSHTGSIRRSERFETTQRFVYDGEDLILAFSGSTNVLTNRYLYGPATDEILADEQLSTATTGTAGTVTWSLGDHLGTIRDLVQYNATTGTTTVVNHVRYDTFGQIVSQTNSQFQPWFAYTGREWDPAVGLYFYRARWYDPRAGRFLSEDPLGFAAGDVNLNRYVGNGATLWVDPSGMILVQYSPSDTPQREPSGLSHGAREVLGGLLEAGAGALVLSGSVLAEAPTLGVATVGVIGGSLLVGDGLDRVIAGFQELTTGKVRDGVLDDIAKYFGGDSAQYALFQLRSQSEQYALTMGLGAVISNAGNALNGAPHAVGGPPHSFNISTTAMTAAERAAAIEYARLANAWLAQNGPVTVQSTAGTLRSQANAAATAQRIRAARAGQPYAGQAGHVPDTALTGKPHPPCGWLDMPGTSNQRVGGGLGSRIGQQIDIITVDGQVPPPLP